MTSLFSGLLESILRSVSDFFDYLVTSIADMAFHAEKYVSLGSSSEIVSSLYNITLGFGISLIVLKFLKKGFEAYTLWTDGDPDMDPLILLTNFFKALAVSLTFLVAYDWICDVALELLDKMLGALYGNTGVSFANIIAGVVSQGIFYVIMLLAFFIVFLLLFIQFLSRGIEMIVLRVGMPLACLGLLDSDKGVFKPYMTKFFQNALTIVVQTFLLRLGLNFLFVPNLIVPGVAGSNANLLWGIATMMMALSTPKFLQEFMIASGGSHNVSGAVYQTARIGQMVKGVLSKGAAK